jgi:glycosyltransferase involved in cell wall biosynthesis
MDGKLPKISIVIPSYNKARFVEETLSSIINQRYPDLEVIIQDGGSTDGTLEIIKRFAKRYPIIIQWESKKDKGQTDAINKGVKKATGEIVTYLNADDVYEKGALKKIGKYFAKHSSTLWVAGKGRIIGENGRKTSEWVADYKNYLLKLNNYDLLLMVNYLMQPSVFLSRRAYKIYGPLTGKKNVMEYNLWLKLGKKYMPKVIDSYLSSFRLYKESVSMREFKKTLLEDERIMRKYTDNPVIIGLHWLHNVARVVIANIW